MRTEVKHHGAPSFALMVLKGDRWINEEQMREDKLAHKVLCCQCRRRIKTRPLYIKRRGKLRPICQECLS